MEETLETFEGLVEVTEDPLFPADINTTIENVDTVLSLLEEDAMDLEVENVRHMYSHLHVHVYTCMYIYYYTYNMQGAYVLVSYMYTV